jgi:hypothetical protein
MANQKTFEPNDSFQINSFVKEIIVQINNAYRINYRHPDNVIIHISRESELHDEFKKFTSKDIDFSESKYRIKGAEVILAYNIHPNDIRVSYNNTIRIN